MPEQLMRFLQLLKSSDPVTELSTQILQEYKLLSSEQTEVVSPGHQDIGDALAKE